jgi:hypothetical protein
MVKTLGRAGPRRIQSGFFVALGLLFAPAAAAGQSCLASPATVGQVLLGLRGGLESHASRLELLAGGNLDGPFGFESLFGVRWLEGADQVGLLATGRGSFDLRLAGLPLCLISGFNHDTWTSGQGMLSVEGSRLTLPVGVGLGRVIGEEHSTTFGVGALEGGALLRRTSTRFRPPGAEEERHTSQTAAGAYLRGRLTLAVGRTFLSAGVVVNSFEEDDPLLTLAAGIRIGGEIRSR